MARKTETQEKAGRRNGSVVVDTVRSVLLASIGAVAMTKEEIEAIVNRLVEKGEIAEKDARKVIQDVLERRRKEAAKVESRLEKTLEERVEAVLSRLNIPTKSDLQALTRKVNELSRKIDELRKE